MGRKKICPNRNHKEATKKIVNRVCAFPRIAEKDLKGSHRRSGFKHMKLLRIGLTSCNIESATSIIQALRVQRTFQVRIVACDTDPLAAGAYLADVSYRIPPITDDSYINTMLTICKKERVSILLPIHASEHFLYSGSIKYFASKGITIPISPRSSVGIYNDKKRWNTLFERNGLPIPRCFTTIEHLSPHTTYVLKPRKSAGSIGVSLVQGKSIYVIPKNFILQEYVKGPEFSVDCVVSKSGYLLAAVIRQRLKTMNGIMTEGRTVHDQQILKCIKTVIKQIPLRGLVNIQVIKSVFDNSVKITDVNARPSAGGLLLCLQAGVNLPLLMLQDELEIPIEPCQSQYEQNIYVTKYFKEIYLIQNHGTYHIV
jgi:carbamoyl-phosphate synthase large subunit